MSSDKPELVETYFVEIGDNGEPKTMRKTRSSQSSSPSKKPSSGNASEAGGGATGKKESFKWSTPADEFANDVESDGSDEDMSDMEDSKEFLKARPNGEKFVGHYDPEEQRRLREEEEQMRNEYGKRRKSKGMKQKFPCPKCDKIWNWPWELRRHLVMHYKEKERQDTTAFKCDECGKGFQWKRDLAQHKRLHTGEKLLICSVCGKKFTTRQALLHHVVVHTGEKPFQCAQCGNRFTQPANLRTHMKKKHDGVAIKNKCPHCQETFQSVVAVHQHILEDHQNIVAEEREAQTLERMKKEQERAAKERQREEARKRREAKRKERQDFNDFRIKGLKEWEINYEFHIGDGIVRGVDWDRTPSNGELVCDRCHRKFGWRYEFMFHNLCHQVDVQGNPKNRVCPECETVFKVPIGLKHHLLTHTGELPFLCLHCWRSFASHIDLKLHLKREHLFHLQVPTPSATPSASARKKVVKEERKIVSGRAGNSNSVRLVMADGQTLDETQTIIVGADGTIMNPNNEDMIVVIQSDDFDQSQGLIVVDPSQLEHVVGSTEGVRTATVTSHDGTTTTMILDNSASASGSVGQGGNRGPTRYINLQFSDAAPDEDEEEETEQSGANATEAEESHIILSADNQFTGSDGSQYVVVSSDASDNKVGIQIQQAQQIQEMLQDSENVEHLEDGGTKSNVIMQFQIIQTPEGDQVQAITPENV